MIEENIKPEKTDLSPDEIDVKGEMLNDETKKRLEKEVKNEGVKERVVVYREGKKEKFSLFSNKSIVLAAKSIGIEKIPVEIYPTNPKDDVYIEKTKKMIQKKEKEASCIKDLIKLSYKFRGFGLYKSISPSPNWEDDRSGENLEEMSELCMFVKKVNPKTILEIGTHRGGSLYLWDRCINSVERLVSVDSGEGIDYFEDRSRMLRKILEKDVKFIVGNSHKKEVFKRVEKSVAPKGVDFLFIDGDHSYRGVKRDYQMYRDLVNSGGYIALHDIKSDVFGGVKEAWKEIKDDRNVKEISCGRGEIGIGVIEKL